MYLAHTSDWPSVSSIQQLQKPKGKFGLVLIRAVIVVGLVVAAARFLAMAYAPRWFPPLSMSQELNCPCLVVADHPTDVSPQAFSATAQSDATDNRADAISKVGRRPANVKQEERQKVAKKQPMYAMARSAFWPVRADPREPTKRAMRNANQHKAKSSVSSSKLAQTSVHLSPFGELHGQ